jgi:hypothetical protein
MKHLIRLLCYWITSVLAAGSVAGVAQLPTYSGSAGSFTERFALYATPFPVALGMLHLPALALGSVICLALASRARRLIVLALGGTLVLAVILHVVAHLARFKDHWQFFVFLTADLAVLLAIGLASGPRQKKGSASTGDAA